MRGRVAAQKAPTTYSQTCRHSGIQRSLPLDSQKGYVRSAEVVKVGRRPVLRLDTFWTSITSPRWMEAWQLFHGRKVIVPALCQF